MLLDRSKNQNLGLHVTYIGIATLDRGMEKFHTQTNTAMLTNYPSIDTASFVWVRYCSYTTRKTPSVSITCVYTRAMPTKP